MIIFKIISKDVNVNHFLPSSSFAKDKQNFITFNYSFLNTIKSWNYSHSIWFTFYLKITEKCLKMRNIKILKYPMKNQKDVTCLLFIVLPLFRNNFLVKRSRKPKRICELYFWTKYTCLVLLDKMKPNKALLIVFLLRFKFHLGTRYLNTFCLY